MIIKSSRNNSKTIYTKPVVEEEEVSIVKKEVKKDNEIISKKRNKHSAFKANEILKTEEEIDFSEWLKDDIDE